MGGFYLAATAAKSCNRAGHRAAAFHGRAKRDGRDRADAAGPSSAVHRRARTSGLAEGVRLHHPRPRRSHIGRFKQVIGDGLRCRTDQRRATEVEVAVHAFNRMLELGRPESVRIA